MPGDEVSVVATIVVADDDADFRDVYATLLRTSGHVVLEAADGIETLDLVRLHRPDLLFLDLWMPALTGFDVLDKLRYDVAGVRLPIVVVSNLGDADSKLEAFEAGATEYLVKGRALADVLQLVEQLLVSPLIVEDFA